MRKFRCTVSVQRGYLQLFLSRAFQQKNEVTAIATCCVSAATAQPRKKIQSQQTKRGVG